MDLLIVGYRGGAHIGGSFERAAERLGIRSHLTEMREAMRGPGPLPRLYWRFCDRRPWRLKDFSESVAAWCEAHNPRMLLATGTVPLLAESLRRIHDSGTVTTNFLTDDPWNPAHRAKWFLEALPYYDVVFNPRRANERELRNCGIKRVEYCQFGYDADLFCADNEEEAASQTATEFDVFFAGGADAERAEAITALAAGGLSIALYGSYWERFEKTRRMARGQLAAEKIGVAAAACRMALCLVRRANRDEHCMRTFEIPALGMAMLAEDTRDHRQIFGSEGDCVLYFGSIREMVEKAKRLVEDGPERRRLAQAAQARIVSGRHRYDDRLMQMLDSVRQGIA